MSLSAPATEASLSPLLLWTRTSSRRRPGRDCSFEADAVVAADADEMPAPDERERVAVTTPMSTPRRLPDRRQHTHVMAGRQLEEEPLTRTTAGRQPAAT